MQLLHVWRAKEYHHGQVLTHLELEGSIGPVTSIEKLTCVVDRSHHCILLRGELHDDSFFVARDLQVVG